MPDVDKALGRLTKVQGPDGQGRYMALCPFHADTDRSLRVFGNGGALCFGACDQTWSPGEFAKALGVEVTDAATNRSQASPIEATYDYTDVNGNLLFQVVRRTGKKFKQRRPDPSKPGEWIWNLRNVTPVLYRLPQLTQADPDEWVFVVEGEKDVERLLSLGLLATTNSQGAGKWVPGYNRWLRGRKVAIVPDNDDAGRQHAELVGKSLYGEATELRALTLPGLAHRGDVSDWLDAGGAKEELLALLDDATPFSPSTNGSGNHEDMAATVPLFESSKWAGVSRRIIQDGLRAHGWFLRAEGLSYFFDEHTKVLAELESFEMAVLLKEKYGINAMETVYSYLVKDMLVEAAVRGEQAYVRQWTHYDPEANVLYMDLGDGRMLALDGAAITEMDNGKHGVLFTPAPNFDSWNFKEGVHQGLVADTLIESLNFVESDNTPHTADEQKTLFLLWLLALPFESIQPTKPLALAMGPAGSGKSSIFRRIGQLLFGSGFNVDGLRRDKEDDFFVATTTRPFVTFDNVDRRISWLDDALATSATGMRVTKRELYHTNKPISYTPRAFIALTARTPRFRRDDVAERLLIFHFERLTNKLPEYDLYREIQNQRDEMLSDYANMLNQVVATPHSPSGDTSIRLADFAAIATRIGDSLHVRAQTVSLLEKLKRSQYMFATEENDLYYLLDAWLAKDRPDEMNLGFSNGARRIQSAQLFTELKDIADSTSIRWTFSSPNALGMALRNMIEPLSIHFTIRYERNRSGTHWTIGRVD